MRPKPEMTGGGETRVKEGRPSRENPAKSQEEVRAQDDRTKRRTSQTRQALADQEDTKVEGADARRQDGARWRMPCGTTEQHATHRPRRCAPEPDEPQPHPKTPIQSARPHHEAKTRAEWADDKREAGRKDEAARRRRRAETAAKNPRSSNTRSKSLEQERGARNRS